MSDQPTPQADDHVFVAPKAGWYQVAGVGAVQLAKGARVHFESQPPAALGVPGVPPQEVVIIAARRVALNAYGANPRHTRARDGGCRDDCIPCGLAALTTALEALDANGNDLGARAGRAADGLESRLALIDALSDHGVRKVLAYLAGHDPVVFDAVTSA